MYGKKSFCQQFQCRYFPIMPLGPIFGESAVRVSSTRPQVVSIISTKHWLERGALLRHAITSSQQVCKGTKEKIPERRNTKMSLQRRDKRTSWGRHSTTLKIHFLDGLFVSLLWWDLESPAGRQQDTILFHSPVKWWTQHFPEALSGNTRSAAPLQYLQTYKQRNVTALSAVITHRR